MQLHLVGGFLGSGKTTAIAAAAKHLMAQGKRVGVVTNDQGKYLVDTAFFRLDAVPTVEVTGGCFCCNYDDLDARLDQLAESAHPDTIFAESVGSCADVVATVVRPLLRLRQTPASFSVFADARLLRQRLRGYPLPFSEDVIYIFDKQLEEAGLLVINKLDLLTEQEGHELRALAENAFPGKRLRLQSSIDERQVAEWASLIESGTLPLPGASLTIDYDRYGAGEAELAWLDQEITFSPGAQNGRQIVIELIELIVRHIRQQQVAIGHLKFLISAGSVKAKISFPALESTSDWPSLLPILDGSSVSILINARAETSSNVLRDLTQQTLQEISTKYGLNFRNSDAIAFHPAFPTPTHRIQ